MQQFGKHRFTAAYSIVIILNGTIKNHLNFKAQIEGSRAIIFQRCNPVKPSVYSEHYC